MKLTLKSPKESTVLYRLNRYPLTAIMTVGIVIIFIFLLYYCLGKIYPDLKLFDNLLPKKAIKYHFYTGYPAGTYHTIGKNVEGEFTRNGDSIINDTTKGGYENAMKVIIQKNSFGLIQEEMINQNDLLRKNVRFITPLFLERMHIIYRKDLFKNCGDQVQLSAVTDTKILRCISDSVKIVNPGPVGSGTRILASYVLTLIGEQIKGTLETFPKYKQNDLSFRKAYNNMLRDDCNKDSLIDILFYVAADPVLPIKKLLDSKKYCLMSIDPSLVIRLNKEFNLNLQIADFKNKYEQTNKISTIGTLAYLIGSKTIRDDAVVSLLHKIEKSKAAIHWELIGDSTKDNLPLKEFGFFNSFSDAYSESQKFHWKELAAFVFSVVTLFFPIFRSVNTIKAVLKSWSINKQIDDAVRLLEKTGRENMGLARTQVFETLSILKEKLIDLYGDGILPEGNFNALMKRVLLYLEKYPRIGVELQSEIAETATRADYSKFRSLR